ncbi:hypothetical protein LA521A_14830 [Lysobacter auxotrophicus]|uniref:Uncharacterized protein n=1 Tax=Lysobacter auxotrophicus TaxID=2992573 RepID=A0ABN6UJ00_9GAMM|nr:hypothetical protein LA521A_14830 [Lysobacter auxotrophicus]
MSFSGFAELNTPDDLLLKLRHDWARMGDDPEDQYAAFDFFVTAEHIIDWLYPDDKNARSALRQENAILRVTSHLANGAKHFRTKDRRHSSVLNVEKSRYVAKGYVEEGYFAEPLLVHLDEEEAGLLGVDGSIDARTLASRVLQFWERKITP